MGVRAINICVVTGRIAGDSDACGDCDPCVYGAQHVPDAVKRLLSEKDEWRDKYAGAMDRLSEERQQFCMHDFGEHDVYGEVCTKCGYHRSIPVGNT